MSKKNKEDKKTVSRLRPIKITTVGDGTVGKTCMLITYTTNSFPSEYVPTVFDNYSGTLCVDGQEFSLTLWDTAGQEDYARIRPLSYTNTDCFLICFSVNSPDSYENVAKKWHPEIKHYCPNIPIVLVGTKGDLRQAENMHTIAFKECKKLKKKIKAYEYVECSALNFENLEEVFIKAIQAVLRKRSSKLCCLS